MSEQVSHDYSKEEKKDPPPLPSNAILDPERKLFRLRKSLGGTIAKGAFGFHLSTATATKLDDENDGGDKTTDNDDKKSSTATTTDADKPNSGPSSPPASPDWYLFIEEAIFLHERGLLQVHDEHEKIMDSYALYRLLPLHNVPLAVFLVYAHLRQQTFKVVRYSAERRRLIREQQEGSSATTAEGDDTTAKRRRRGLVPKLLRRAAAHATLPPLNDLAEHVAWDVYAPDAPFQKKRPGWPAFSVLVTSHGVPFPVERLRSLLNDADPVPVKVATVADTGTVIVFGVTDLGAPSIVNENQKQATDEVTNDK